MKKWDLPSEKIIEYIKKNHVYKVRREGEEYIICNPLNDDIGFHFNINPKKGICHDWRGDDTWAGQVNPKSGKRNVSFLNFIRLIRQCSFEEAYRLIAGIRPGLSAIEPLGHEVIEDQIQLPAGATIINEHGSALMTTILMWLIRRGYNQEDVEHQALHHNGNDVVWPYFEFGEMVYWQSRSFINKTFRFPDRNIYKEGKVVGVNNVSKGDFLFGFDDVAHNGRCFITESIFDKNSIGLGAIASGGAALTDNQCKKLRLTGAKEIVLTPDNDKAGLQSIVQNYNKIRPYVNDIYYVVPPKACNGKNIKDWNELITEAGFGREDIKRYIDNNLVKIDENALIRLKIKAR